MLLDLMLLLISGGVGSFIFTVSLGAHDNV
jgi:hypothetical protein